MAERRVKLLTEDVVGREDVQIREMGWKSQQKAPDGGGDRREKRTNSTLKVELCLSAERERDPGDGHPGDTDREKAADGEKAADVSAMHGSGHPWSGDEQGTGSSRRLSLPPTSPWQGASPMGFVWKEPCFPFCSKDRRSD